MNTKLKFLALSLGLGASLAATQAQAFVYADSRLLINNLIIGITGAPTITNFTFTNTNTAALNGAAVIQQATCSGSQGAPGPGTNDCNAALPRLNPAAANAPGGSAAATRGNLDFAFKGPLGGLQFSNSASSIDQSNVTGDGSTFTRQVAESELQGGASAAASSQIQSITGFTFTFFVGGASNLSLAFGADADQLAQISELFNGLFSAQSNMSTSFTLQQTTGGTNRAVWAPSGTALNDCVVFPGSTITCVETADGGNLNATIGTTSINTSSALNTLAGSFGININGLTSGFYNLTLAATTSTQLSRRVVPEPDVLLLLGTGLAALGLSAKRRAKKQAAKIAA